MGKKLCKTPYWWKKVGCGGMYLSYTRKGKIRGSWSRMTWEKKQDSKATRAKRAGGMTQVVESLSHKCKALSSNPSTTKNPKNQTATGEKKFSILSQKLNRLK
jgi:hypothetical protein